MADANLFGNALKLERARIRYDMMQVRLERGRKLNSHLADALRRRAEIEKQYAESLRKLSTEMTIGQDELATFAPAWSEMTKDLATTARLHQTFATSLQTTHAVALTEHEKDAKSPAIVQLEKTVEEKLAEVERREAKINALQDTHKTVSTQVSALAKEKDKDKQSQLKKMKAKLDTTETKMKSSFTKLKKVTGEFDNDASRLFSQYQHVEEDRLKRLKATLLAAVMANLDTLGGDTKATTALRDALQTFDVVADLQAFANVKDPASYFNDGRPNGSRSKPAAAPADASSDEGEGNDEPAMAAAPVMTPVVVAAVATPAAATPTKPAGNGVMHTDAPVVSDPAPIIVSKTVMVELKDDSDKPKSPKKSDGASTAASSVTASPATSHSTATSTAVSPAAAPKEDPKKRAPSTASSAGTAASASVDDEDDDKKDKDKKIKKSSSIFRSLRGKFKGKTDEQFDGMGPPPEQGDNVVSASTAVKDSEGFTVRAEEEDYNPFTAKKGKKDKDSDDSDDDETEEEKLAASKPKFQIRIKTAEEVAQEKAQAAESGIDVRNILGDGAFGRGTIRRRGRDDDSGENIQAEPAAAPASAPAFVADFAAFGSATSTAEPASAGFAAFSDASAAAAVPAFETTFAAPAFPASFDAPADEPEDDAEPEGAAAQAAAGVERSTEAAVVIEPIVTETVNAYFEGGELKRFAVAGEFDLVSTPELLEQLQQLPEGSYSVRLLSSIAVEKIVPNGTSLVAIEGEADTFDFEVAAALQQLSSAAQLPLLKYQMVAADMTDVPAQLVPLLVNVQWKCAENLVSLLIAYERNPDSPIAHEPLAALSFLVTIEGEVSKTQSKPAGLWSKEKGKMLWKIGDLPPCAEGAETSGQIKARFEVPVQSKPGNLAIKFQCDTSSLLGMSLQEVDLNGPIEWAEGVQRLTTGKYTAE